ncbi:MAG: histidine kinase [Pseudonocardiaceae bacterium]
MSAPLYRACTYRRWLHLLLGGALLLPAVLLVWVLARALGDGVGGNPFAIILFTAVTVGLSALVALLPAVRVREVAVARVLLGVELPDQTIEGARAWPARWRSAGWLLLTLVVGGVATVATLFVLAVMVQLVSAPVALWAPPAALGCGLALIYLAAGLGTLLARWAPPLLGATPDEAAAALSHRATALAERNRVARELNGSLRHALTVSAVQAGAARRMLGSDPAFVESALVTIEQTGRAALQDLNHVLGLLRDEPDDAGPRRGLADIEGLVAQARSSGMPVRLKMSGNPSRVPSAVAREAYRIVQEGLDNALRHAGPVPVSLRLAVTRDALDVELTHPVTASPEAPVDGGNGLARMRERVEALRGALSAAQQNGQFRVAARLPLRSP